MNKWEEKQKTLQREFKENFTPQMKIAIMTNMMPAAIQEFIYTTVNPDMTYEQIVEKPNAMPSMRGLGAFEARLSDKGTLKKANVVEKLEEAKAGAKEDSKEAIPGASKEANSEAKEDKAKVAR